MQQSYRKRITKKIITGSRTYIAVQATLIGDVVLGDDVSIWPGAVIRGDMHNITIGHRSNIQDGAILHVTHCSEYNPDGYSVAVGQDVTIGHGAILHGCNIQDRVLIGMGAIIMDGVHIDQEVMLAAGALVTPNTHLESGFLYCGSPARKKRQLSAEELKFLLYSAKNYVILKDEYLAINLS